MIFSSNEFLFLYLPLSLTLYFFTPRKRKNLTLLVVSLAFYGWERPTYLLIMASVIAIGYIFGLLIDRAEASRKKRLMAFGVATNIAILAFFKYSDFLLTNLAKIPLLSFIEPLGIGLPIGISFYVFQSTSYIIDVYRGGVQPQRKLVDFGAYISMFPQLIAGPIVRYSDIAAELDKRRHTLKKSAEGARRFVIGLAKKVLLADVAGEMWESINSIERGEASVLLLWLGISFYTFQIYFDFSGYTDMAIGIGKVLGFDFPENFDYPYTSKSITEFWRRWHMTLSSWFREYVYIPLGGSRCGRARLIVNLLVVWLLTGLWHGASWNFALWGLYYFVLLTAEKLFLLKWLEKAPNLLRRTYTLLFVIVGWLIFYYKSSVGGIGAFATYFSGMLGGIDIPFTNREFIYTLIDNFVFIIILCIASTPHPKNLLLKLESRISNKNTKTAFHSVLDVLLALTFVICIAYISSSEYRPNIYFEF